VDRLGNEPRRSGLAAIDLGLWRAVQRNSPVVLEAISDGVLRRG